MYLGCYVDPKKYIGAERAKEYCSCTIKMLTNEYSNVEIEEFFKKNLRKL